MRGDASHADILRHKPAAFSIAAASTASKVTPQETFRASAAMQLQVPQSFSRGARDFAALAGSSTATRTPGYWKWQGKVKRPYFGVHKDKTGYNTLPSHHQLIRGAQDAAGSSRNVHDSPRASPSPQQQQPHDSASSHSLASSWDLSDLDDWTSVSSLHKRAKMKSLEQIAHQLNHGTASLGKTTPPLLGGSLSRKASLLSDTKTSADDAKAEFQALAPLVQEHIAKVGAQPHDIVPGTFRNMRDMYKRKYSDFGPDTSFSVASQRRYLKHIARPDLLELFSPDLRHNNLGPVRKLAFGEGSRSSRWRQRIELKAGGYNADGVHVVVPYQGKNHIRKSYTPRADGENQRRLMQSLQREGDNIRRFGIVQGTARKLFKGMKTDIAKAEGVRVAAKSTVKHVELSATRVRQKATSSVSARPAPALESRTGTQIQRGKDPKEEPKARRALAALPHRGPSEQAERSSLRQSNSDPDYSPTTSLSLSPPRYRRAPNLFMSASRETSPDAASASSTKSQYSTMSDLGAHASDARSHFSLGAPSQSLAESHLGLSDAAAWSWGRKRKAPAAPSPAVWNWGRTQTKYRDAGTPSDLHAAVESQVRRGWLFKRALTEEIEQGASHITPSSTTTSSATSTHVSGLTNVSAYSDLRHLVNDPSRRPPGPIPSRAPNAVPWGSGNWRTLARQRRVLRDRKQEAWIPYLCPRPPCHMNRYDPERSLGRFESETYVAGATTEPRPPGPVPTRGPNKLPWGEGGSNALSTQRRELIQQGKACWIPHLCPVQAKGRKGLQGGAMITPKISAEHIAAATEGLQRPSGPVPTRGYMKDPWGVGTQRSLTDQRHELRTMGKAEWIPFLCPDRGCKYADRPVDGHSLLQGLDPPAAPKRPEGPEPVRKGGRNKWGEGGDRSLTTQRAELRAAGQADWIPFLVPNKERKRDYSHVRPKLAFGEGSGPAKTYQRNTLRAAGFGQDDVFLIVPGNQNKSFPQGNKRLNEPGASEATHRRWSWLEAQSIQKHGLAEGARRKLFASQSSSLTDRQKGRGNAEVAASAPTRPLSIPNTFVAHGPVKRLRSRLHTVPRYKKLPDEENNGMQLPDEENNGMQGASRRDDARPADTSKTPTASSEGQPAKIRSMTSVYADLLKSPSDAGEASQKMLKRQRLDGRDVEMSLGDDDLLPRQTSSALRSPSARSLPITRDLLAVRGLAEERTFAPILEEEVQTILAQAPPGVRPSKLSTQRQNVGEAPADLPGGSGSLRGPDQTQLVEQQASDSVEHAHAQQRLGHPFEALPLTPEEQRRLDEALGTRVVRGRQWGVGGTATLARQRRWLRLFGHFEQAEE
ncbi:hypothetical protein CBOM_06549 [Ceraceosorus bombacis]|uniref:Uncharacterized protein n=1 Tax=Ceraceosorus bombacis TaxID=401625 RepID=A0A0P1BKB0_9BASI|nr:hypothetical protein CBOM_06549 [Ceraceosorus bombacis]